MEARREFTHRERWVPFELVKILAFAPPSDFCGSCDKMIPWLARMGDSINGWARFLFADS